MLGEIPKERVLEMLRERGDHDDAARADLELPDAVDPDLAGPATNGPMA